MDRELFNTEVIEKNIITQAISAFDANSILKNVNYNLYNAFNTEVMGLVDGDEIKLTMQKLEGSNEPSILVDNQINANTLIPIQEVNRLRMVSLSYDLLLDDRKIRSKKIDPNQVFLQAKNKLEVVMWSLMLTGSYANKRVLANSLISQGNITKSAFKFNDKTKTANDILSVFIDAMGRVTDATGRVPNVLLIEPTMLNAISVADAKISNFVVNDFLAKQLGLKIYPTPYLRNVKVDNTDYGSCFVLTTDSEEDLKCIIGELPFLGKTIDDSAYSTRTSVQTSFAGFCRMNENPNAVQIVTNIG